MAEVPSLNLVDGDKIPQIGLGTWQLTGDRCEKALKAALSLGYTHIDTADFYDNQKQIGKAIVGHDREGLFITSKVFHSHLKSKDIVSVADKALRELGTQYVDLMLIHWPNRGIDIKDTMTGFARLKEDGKIRHFGVSNHTSRHIKDVEEAIESTGVELKIATEQVECHPHFRQKELRSLCEKSKIVLEGYSPLGHGKSLIDKTLAKIAKKHDKTNPQVAIRWALQNDIIPLPKASTEEHLRQNIDVLDFKLDEDDLRLIESLKEERILNPPFISDFGYE